MTNRELRDRLCAMNAEIMGQPKGFDPFYGAPEELREINMEFNARYIKGDDMPGRRSCVEY